MLNLEKHLMNRFINDEAFRKEVLKPKKGANAVIQEASNYIHANIDTVHPAIVNAVNVVILYKAQDKDLLEAFNEAYKVNITKELLDIISKQEKLEDYRLWSSAKGAYLYLADKETYGTVAVPHICTFMSFVSNIISLDMLCYNEEIKQYFEAKGITPTDKQVEEAEYALKLVLLINYLHIRKSNTEHIKNIHYYFYKDGKLDDSLLEAVETYEADKQVEETTEVVAIELSNLSEEGKDALKMLLQAIKDA